MFAHTACSIYTQEYKLTKSLMRTEKIYLQCTVFSPFQELNKALHHTWSGNDFIDRWVGFYVTQTTKVDDMKKKLILQYLSQNWYQ